MSPHPAHEDSVALLAIIRQAMQDDPRATADAALFLNGATVGHLSAMLGFLAGVTVAAMEDAARCHGVDPDDAFASLALRVAESEWP